MERGYISKGRRGILAVLPQLLDLDRYRPCDWDLKADAAGRAYWAGVFRENLTPLLGAIEETYPDADRDRLNRFRDRFQGALRDILVHPEQYEEINILTFVAVRQRLQREFGFTDPYQSRKRRENEIAFLLLPEILRESDSATQRDRPRLLALNLMAGNLFDLGASAAMEHYANHDHDYYRLRDSLPKRPWLVDAGEIWADFWERTNPVRHAAVFVDNAGSDIILGCFPLARWMMRRGTRVTLLANSEPTLNDVTASECADLVETAAQIDPELSRYRQTGLLAVRGSGNWAPLIDLRQLSEECVAAINDADLIVLHGMGRAIESNYYAKFSCPALHSAVLKDEAVARRLGGRLFDCVFRFQP